MNRTWMMLGILIGMLIVAYYTSSTTLEIVATTTGLFSVWLTARENIWAWPIGIVNVACFFFGYYEVKLYAEMVLQVFFFALSIIGWVIWLTKRGTAKVRATSRIRPGVASALAIFLVVATLGWGYMLSTHTDASFPYADALIAI